MASPGTGATLPLEGSALETGGHTSRMSVRGQHQLRRKELPLLHPSPNPKSPDLSEWLRHRELFKLIRVSFNRFRMRKVERRMCPQQQVQESDVNGSHYKWLSYS